MSAESRIQVAATTNYLDTATRTNAAAQTVHDECVLPALGHNRMSIVDINRSSSGAAVLVAAVAAKRAYAWKLHLHAAGAVTVTFKSASTTLPGPLVFESAGDKFIDFDAEPWWLSEINENFSINLSASVAVTGALYYTTQP
jgi:hypothetical protein